MPTARELLLGSPRAALVGEPPLTEPTVDPTKSPAYNALLTGQDVDSLTATTPAPKAEGIVDQLGQELLKFGEETALAVPRMFKGAFVGVRDFAEVEKNYGHQTAMKAFKQNVRETLGLPLDAEDEKSLAEDIKNYHELKIATGLSREEAKAEARGLVNLVSFAPGGIGAKAAQGVMKAERLIANPVLRKMAAAEAHSIASFVSYNVANAVIEGEDVAKAALEGAALGAVVPPALKGAGKVVGKTLQGAIKGTGATAKALDRAALRIPLYVGARNEIARMGGMVVDRMSSTDTLLRKNGLGQIADELWSSEKASHLRAADWTTRTRAAFRKLTKGDANTLGIMLHMPEEDALKFAQQNAKNPEFLFSRMQQVGTVLKEVAEAAQQQGVTQIDTQTGALRYFTPRQDFGFPHVFVNTEKFLEPGAIREEAITKLVERHGMTRERAIETLDIIHKRNQFGYANLMGRRYNLPGFISDPRTVLPEYFMNMARKIENHARFRPENLPEAPGVTNEFPGAFIGVEDLPDGIREVVRDGIKDQLGAFEKQSAFNQSLSKLAQSEAVTKLGLSQITQLTQFVAPYITTGFRGMGSDILKSMSRDPAMQDRYARTGAFLPGLIRATELPMLRAQAQGFFPALAQKTLKATGFTAMDTQARVLGSIRGMTQANYLAEDLQGLLRNRGKFGVEKRIAQIEKKFAQLDIDAAEVMNRGGVLTEEENLRAGLKLSTDVNFWGNALSLPRWTRSPWGRIAFQFKTFSYQQAAFMDKAVRKPLVEDGDAEPLMRALVLMGASGELIQDVKSFLRNKPRNDDGVKRLAHNIMAGGGFGIAADMIRSADFGDKGLLAAAAGPLASDISELGYGISKVVMHGKSRSLGKQAISTLVPIMGSYVPIIGPTVAPMASQAIKNAVYPPQQPAEGQ